jgi:hypothetical protein
VTIRDIELAEKINKGQFTLPTPTRKIVTMPAICAIVLAA